MCLTVKVGEKPRKARKDIVCYKMLSTTRDVPSKYAGKQCVATIDGIVLDGILLLENGSMFICHDERRREGQPLDGIIKNPRTYSWLIDDAVSSVIVDNKEVVIEVYETYFQGSRIEIGKTYKSNLILEGNEVEIGLHSFKNPPDEEDFRIWVKCIIPKGSYYFRGHFSDEISYAADTLQYVELINA